MRFLALFTIATTLLIYPNTLDAREVDSTRHVFAYFGGGASLPGLATKDFLDLGFHGQVRLGFPSTSRMELVPSLEVHSLPINTFSSSPEANHLNLFMFSGGLKYFVLLKEGNSKPFVQFDIGACKVSTTGGTLSGLFDFGSGSEFKPFVSMGMGIDFVSTSTSDISLTFRFVRIFTDQEDISLWPISLTIKAGS
jgi:hypothetical protein